MNSKNNNNNSSIKMMMQMQSYYQIEIKLDFVFHSSFIHVVEMRVNINPFFLKIAPENKLENNF